MIQLTVSNDCYSIPPIVTFGVSDVAEYVVNKAQEQREHMQKTESLGLRAKGVFDELRMVADECHDSGWDGYCAEPVTEETTANAEQFLMTLPLGIAPPSIGAEPDGCLTFEWYKSPVQLLSISISEDGFLHYAYLSGSRKKYGSEPFSSSISKDIIALILEIKS